MDRRDFMTKAGMAATGAMFSPAVVKAITLNKKKKKLVLVGTGARGHGFWGKKLVDRYADYVEFAGICDINPGRVKFAKDFMGVSCPTFTSFDEMLEKTDPDLAIVCTVDSTHDEFVIKSLEYGIDVITEKPMVTDEHKCQAIIDAERKSGKKVIVGFNYRWAPYMTKIKELLVNNTIGEVTSVDFHWYLNTYHGASYFRRWHGMTKNSGSLWVHKSTHHFDLVNWWLNSEPEEVMAYGSLEYYGKNGKFRGKKCRDCDHKSECMFFYDILKDEAYTKMYVDNEKYDGYIRDNCLFREEIDIYDKMSAQVKYANNVTLNYSLTTYSPFEGWRIAFNGKEGRIEAWDDIPYYSEMEVDQAELHAAEMDQSDIEKKEHKPIIVHRIREDYERIIVASSKGGHGGGDLRMQNKIFMDPNAPDPYGHAAGTRDGAMSCLIGVAARKSIEEKKAIRIEDLSEYKPQAIKS